VPGFLANGFREIGRKSNRFGIRRQLAAQERKRQDALAALGRAAWQAGIDLAAFGPQREQLQKLHARVGELSVTAARLEKERADLEARRQAEVARFDGLLQPARGKQADADAALKAALAALTGKEQAIKAAGAAAPPTPADAEARQALAAEVGRRTEESTKAANEVNRLEAEKKAALAPIDADLKRVRQESIGAETSAWRCTTRSTPTRRSRRQSRPWRRSIATAEPRRRPSTRRSR
jgi:chromosome segregation ATPase